MNKKEFKELDREQMIIAFNQLKDDYSVLFDKLEQEKEKNKELKSSIDYLQKIEPEKLKIIVDSWNEKVMTNFEKEWICKDKIREKIEEIESDEQYNWFGSEWSGSEVVGMLEDLLEEV